MIYKDLVSGISYEIPGKHDYEILLDPAELLFMPNVDDSSVAEAEGYTVYEDKKSLIPKKKNGILGVWYSKEEPTTAPRAKHAVRLIPPARRSLLMPDSETQAIVYPIPLYSGGDSLGVSQSYIATLLLFVTHRAIFTSLHGTIESHDLHVLSEQLLTEAASHDPAVESLTWVRDHRNTSACAFPGNAMDVEKDILAHILKLAVNGDHIPTRDERQTAILKRKKIVQIAGIVAVFLLAGTYGIHFMRTREANELSSLRNQNVAFTQALMLQRKEASSYDYLVTSLSKQPDYTWTLMRLYAGTFGLTQRHFFMNLQVRSDTPVLLYSISGKSFARIDDIRPAILDQLKQNGFVPKSVDMVPVPNLTPVIRIQGEASLGAH